MRLTTNAATNLPRYVCNVALRIRPRDRFERSCGATAKILGSLQFRSVRLSVSSNSTRKRENQTSGYARRLPAFIPCLASRICMIHARQGTPQFHSDTFCGFLHLFFHHIANNPSANWHDTIQRSVVCVNAHAIQFIPPSAWTLSRS